MLTHSTNDSESRGKTEDVGGRATDAEAAETRIELWCEPIHTGGRTEFAHVVERLLALSRDGYVDTVTVETWDRYVDVTGGYPEDDVPRATLDRIDQLDRWARQRGDRPRITRKSQVAGRGRLGPSIVVRRVPRAALVEFENGVVTNVTLADERTACLTDRLDRIAERERVQAVDRHRDGAVTRE